MAFADPQSIKVDGTNTVSLPRVNTGDYQSEYLSEDGTIRLKIQTVNGRRKRQQIRVDLTKITTDPFDTTQNIEISSSIYLQIDRPLSGFTNTDMLKAIEGLVAFLSASTYSAVKKALASES